MKLVSSAKLRKAQNAIEAMRPYQEQLQGILASLEDGQLGGSSLKSAQNEDDKAQKGLSSLNRGKNKDEKISIVAIASNSSLCGGFNANAIAKVRSIRRRGDTVYAIGRKMADAMRKDGFTSPEDLSALAEHPAYGPAAALVEKLVEDVEAGRTGAVVLVYNHFVSTARQEPVVEVLIQRETPDQVGGDRGAGEESLSGTFARTGSRSDVEERPMPSVTVVPRGGDAPARYVTLPGFESAPVAFGSDAPHLTGFGHKIICGPGTIRVAHRPDEHVLVHDLETAVAQYVKMYHALLCGGK